MCWSCYRTQLVENAFARGYSAGAAEAIARAAFVQQSGISIDRHRQRQLRQLCHPDRHDQSPLAHEVAAWLNLLASRS